MATYAVAGAAPQLDSESTEEIYNRDGTGGVLVGNWVEQRALRDIESAQQELGASTLSGVESITDALTHPRVVEHSTTQLQPQDWRSMYTMSFKEAKNAPNAVEYGSTSMLGPREKLAMQAMMREAENLPDSVIHALQGAPIPPTLTSTYRDSFYEQESVGSLGRRVMKDPDGRETLRDPTFLAETNIVTKHLADRLFQDPSTKSMAAFTARLPDPDVPVTIYSESVALSKYGGTFKGTQPLSSSIPFNKQHTFSTPMSDYRKVVMNE